MPEKEIVSEEVMVAEAPKRRVGRPRKVVSTEEGVGTNEPKRRVGRPKKQAVMNEDESGMLPLTLGMKLQQARHQQHIKLSSVSKKLCIKETYLEALEEGRYYAFPALVYGAGFLRAYATFLGLDANEMAERFRRETTDINTESLDMPRATEPGALPKPKTIIKSLLVLLLLYLVWNAVKIITHKPFPEPALPVVEERAPADPAVQEVPVTVDELVPPQPEEKNKEKSGKGQTQKDVKQVKADTASAVLVPKKTGVSYGLKTPARVSFVATDRVGIEILDTEANSVLFQKTLEPGDRYNPVDGVDGMVLRTTNAGGLDVYIDGKKVKTLGKKGQAKTGVSMSAADLLKD